MPSAVPRQASPESAPDHLPIYLTNRCNLQCSYCYVAVNQGPPARLDFEGLKPALDAFFASEVSPKKITFLGGEPFLDYPFLVRIAEYVRERTGWGDAVVLQTFTNGTLLTPERARELHRLGVHVSISLDGKRADNDKNRVFAGKPGSTLDAALRRLEGIPKDNLGASLVFTAGSAARLVENVDYFYRMGFPRITFTPELYERWPEESLAVLERSLAGFRRYYHAILASGARAFQIQILFSAIENRRHNAAGVAWWHGCHNRTVGPDGHFYACDKALSFPVGAAPGQRTGTLAEGDGVLARAAHYRRAIAWLEERGFGADEYFCPMGPYFYSELAGEDPLPRVENFHRVAKIFSDALLGIVDDNKDLPAYRSLYEDVLVA